MAFVWLALALGLGGWVAPTLRWLYHIERAGALMDRGLAWPAAHQIDRLPVARDPAALALARDHLASARLIKPDSARAYRMLGQLYAGEHAWERAAEAFDRARARAPADPLIRWEAALVEARLWQATVPAAQTPFAPPLDARFVRAPATPISTPACQSDQPARCYVAAMTVSQPLAVAPSQPLSATALFLHPPASLTFTLPVTRGQTALLFLLGLLPAAQPWNTDGVTYEIWIGDERQSGRLIYSRTLDAAALAGGWTSDWVDLADWAGQTIALTLRTGAGPQNDTSSDWAIWGNFILADADQAPMISRYPYERMRHEFALAGYPNDDRPADALFRLGEWDRADQAYQQALRQADLPPDARFRAVLAGAMVNRLPRDPQPRLGVPVHAITATSLIEGEGMHWLQASSPLVRDGTPLGRSSLAGVAAAPLWWGGAAAAIIDIAVGGTYQISVRAASSPGAAAQVALEADGQALPAFDTAADGSFRDYRFTLDLAPGTHVLGVRLLNDGIRDGVDTNAFIDWLRMTRQSQP